MFPCPLRVGRIATCPAAPARDTAWHGRPELKSGPSVRVTIAVNARLCPPIARNSDHYTRLGRTRTTTGRSTSMKKQKFKLLQARRPPSGWLTGLVKVAIVQHAKVRATRDKAARSAIEGSLRRDATLPPPPLRSS